VDLYLDSLDVEMIERYAPFIRGVTSTPTFAQRERLEDYGVDLFKQILGVLGSGKTLHISAPFSTVKEIVDYLKFVTDRIPQLAEKRIVFKLPCTETGLRVARRYGRMYDIGLHMIYTVGQVILANETPAKWHYLLVGRGIEYGYDMNRVAALSRRAMLASIRSADMVEQFVDLNIPMTVPPQVLEALTECKHTRDGQTKFIDDFLAGNCDGFTRVDCTNVCDLEVDTSNDAYWI